MSRRDLQRWARKTYWNNTKGRRREDDWKTALLLIGLVVVVFILLNIQ